jgi:hypothetical protein
MYDPITDLKIIETSHSVDEITAAEDRIACHTRDEAVRMRLMTIIKNRSLLPFSRATAIFIFGLDWPECFDFLTDFANDKTELPELREYAFYSRRAPCYI